MGLRRPCCLSLIEGQVLQEKWQYPAVRRCSAFAHVCEQRTLGVYNVDIFTDFPMRPVHLNLSTAPKSRPKSDLHGHVGVHASVIGAMTK